MMTDDDRLSLMAGLLTILLERLGGEAAITQVEMARVTSGQSIRIEDVAHGRAKFLSLVSTPAPEAPRDLDDSVGKPVGNHLPVPSRRGDAGVADAG